MEKEIEKIKKFILINSCGVYDAKDWNKEFDERLKENEKWIEENKKELSDRAISNNSKC